MHARDFFSDRRFAPFEVSELHDHARNIASGFERRDKPLDPPVNVLSLRHEFHFAIKSIVTLREADHLLDCVGS